MLLEFAPSRMANFTTISLDQNTGTNGTPTWTAIGGASTETRWNDQTGQTAVASASWPATLRPASTQAVPYQYAYTADAVGLLVLGGAFSNANYNQNRWNWDAVGTFASAPIATAYPTTAHGAVTRNDGSVLGGSADTGGTARSYLKGNAFGRVDSAGAPAAAAANAPVVTDGATGVLTPAAGANWLTNYQGLQGDNDYIQFPSTPAATAADTWHLMLALFMGPGMNTGMLTWQISLKYTWQ